MELSVQILLQNQKLTQTAGLKKKNIQVESAKKEGFEEGLKKGSDLAYEIYEYILSEIENGKSVDDLRNDEKFEDFSVMKIYKAFDCLFTMTERMSRNEIARKMPNTKGKSTVAVLDEIERKIGSVEFRRIFITMTCDGGSEFMDIDGIERSCIDGKPRTKLYFAPPYTACEHGMNENHNRILRRFFPKGCDFSQISDEEVANAENWMNNYPRRIHGGKTPAMIFKNCREL